MVLFTAWSGATTTGGQGVEEFLSRMSGTVAELKAIKGTFRQEVEMTLMEERKSYSGRIFSMYPDLLRLEYDDPIGQLLVCDGTWFWMYLTDQDRPQVFKTPVGRGVGGFLSHTILKMLKESFVGRMDAEEDVEGVLCYKIYFTPDAEYVTPQIDNLFLWVGKDDLLTRKLSYEDLAGNRITYNFYGWQTLDSLPADFFSFTPSQDADLFDDLLSP
jgi:outer membrane lipoprotein-sorting protein